MNVKKYITEESIKKIQESINNGLDFYSDGMKEQVVNEILDILRNDEKFQEFSEQMMKKIILGE
jgi:hypothetical protein